MNRFFFTHDAVIRTLHNEGVENADHLDRLGRRGDEIVEEKLVGNALHVYSMYRRCVHFVDKVMTFLEEREGVGQVDDDEEEEEGDPIRSGLFLRQFRSLREGASTWPREDDLELAALAVARIQYVYQLDAADLMGGHIGDRDTGVQETIPQTLRRL